MHYGTLRQEGLPVRRPPNRTTADLSPYPGLVVIYLGMSVVKLFGPADRREFRPRLGGLRV